MALITLDIPDDIHRKVKRLQLDKEEDDKKINLKDLYIELIKQALETKKATH